MELFRAGHRVDIILMNHDMKGNDGYQITSCRKQKENAACTAI